jgi:hypothetical protein
LAASGLKLAYWRAVDAGLPGPTAEDATSLGAIGRVRPLDPPHTQQNYLLAEMGFRVARKHAGRLRAIALAAGFAAPAALALWRWPARRQRPCWRSARCWRCSACWWSGG